MTICTSKNCRIDAKRLRFRKGYDMAKEITRMDVLNEEKEEARKRFG